jgi:hypothetical protein
MQIEFHMMIVASLLIATACKKHDDIKINPEEDLLVKRAVTVLTDSKGNDPFVSTEEILFDYDHANSLSKIAVKIIHKFTNRADTIDRGYDEFIHDETGKLIRRNRLYYNVSLQSYILISYDELTYNDIKLPKQVSSYSLQWDPIVAQEVFKQSQYNEYTYSSNTQLAEKITYSPGYDQNGASTMLQIFRTVYHYDPVGNITTAAVYPLSESYGTLGELTTKEEYQYVQQGNNPMFFGLAYSSLYTSGTIILASNPILSTRHKSTQFYHRWDWPDLYQTKNFVVEMGSNGYPERIIEIYAKETYARLPTTDRPMLLTERGKRDSRFEYIAKR